jgi:hypothetical protein
MDYGSQLSRGFKAPSRFGAAFPNPVRLSGRHGLRACVSDFRTTRSDIDLIVARVVQIARRHQRGCLQSEQ